MTGKGRRTPCSADGCLTHARRQTQARWRASPSAKHFYVGDTFVRHCLTMIDQIFAGLGAFVRRNDCSSGP